MKDFNGCDYSDVLALNDTLAILSGKWKIYIIRALLAGKHRFNELHKKIPKITPRMLSKELKELELNGVVNRTVYNTVPVTVEYELTSSGIQLKELISEMVRWGLLNRELVKKSNESEIPA